MAAPVQALILDLDGTLLDHVGSVTAALQEWLPTLGTFANDDLISAWFDAEHRHFPAWRAREVTFAEQRRRRLRDFLPVLGITPGHDNDLDAIFQGYLERYEGSWTKFDDVDPALAAITETTIKIAVLSNGTEDQQHAKLTAIGLSGRVGPVFTAEGLGAAKPAASTFLDVCAELDIAPAFALHVGDLYDLDVLAPRAAGLQALHLDRIDAGPHDEPCRIRSLAQLPQWLSAV